MSDDVYELKVDGDISALSETIRKTMQELSSSVQDSQAEQIRSAARLEQEKLSGINKLSQIELQALKVKELEHMRYLNRVALMEKRAAMRGGVGGAGNTNINGGFMQSMLGAENVTASFSTKIRVVSAEFLKMATFSRTATLSLNAFKGASSWLVGGAVGLAVFALATGLRMLGNRFMEARREAKALREEQEKVNKELTKTAVILGTPKVFLGALSGLKDNERMLQDAAEKGFVGVPGLSRLGAKYDHPDKNIMAANMVIDGFSKEAATAFTQMWKVTKGRLSDLEHIAKQSAAPLQSFFAAFKNNMTDLRNKGFGSFPVFGALGGALYDKLNDNQTKVADAAATRMADIKESLSRAEWFNLEDLTKAADTFKASQKEAAKKVKDIQTVILDSLTKTFVEAFNAQKKRMKDFDKWLEDRNDPSKAKYGVDSPADSFYTMNKAVADYATTLKSEQREIIDRLDKLVEGDYNLLAVWQQLEAF